MYMYGRAPSKFRSTINRSVDARPTPGRHSADTRAGSAQHPVYVLWCVWMLRDVDDNIPGGPKQPDRFQDYHEDQVTAMEFGANSSVDERSPVGARIYMPPDGRLTADRSALEARPTLHKSGREGVVRVSKHSKEPRAAAAQHGRPPFEF